MVETFDCSAARPCGIGTAARRGSLHHATAQPLFQPFPPSRIRGWSRFCNRLLSALDSFLRPRKKPLASAPLSDYSSTMIPDITLGIVFTFILLGIGTVAFLYLLKGKN